MRDDLDQSELIIAAILAHLARKGVNRTNLSVEKIDPEGQRAFNPVLFYDAIRWLSDEGIIRFTSEETVGSLRVSACVLTAYGFALIQARRVLGTNFLTVGEAMQQIEKGESQFTKAEDYTGGLLGALTKSFGV